MNIFAELCCFNTPNNLFLNKKISKYLAPNFSVMLAELYQLGWTQEKISYLVSVSGASTIGEWANGGIPNFDNGETFIELWKHLTDKTEKEIPRINRYLLT